MDYFHNYPILQEIGTIWVGAFIADVSAHPFLTLWTIKQSHFYCSYPIHHRDIFKTQGIKGLYAGFTPQAMSGLPGYFLYLKSRKQTLELFGENHLGFFMQGPLGVSAGMLVWSPAMRLTVLQQGATTANTFNQLTLTGKCQYIFKKEGIRGLYRGTMGSAFSFSINDAIGSWLQAQLLNCYPVEERNQIIPQLSSTTLAFVFATFITTPIETVTSHLRLHETNPEQFPHTKFSTEMKRIFSQKGCRGFFKAAPTLIGCQAWRLILPFTTVNSN